MPAGPNPNPPPTLFPSNTSLSYPHFNTYRLSSPSPLQLKVHPLPPNHYATSSRFRSKSTTYSGGEVLGLKDVKARTGWDHLNLGVREGEVVWVDEEYEVVVAKVISSDGEDNEERGKEVAYRGIASLPVPLPASNPREDERQPLPEYPSVLSIPTRYTSTLGSNVQDREIYLASNGVGALSIISTPLKGKGEAMIVEMDLIIPHNKKDDPEEEHPHAAQPYPFLLHSLHVPSQGEESSMMEVILTRTLHTPLESLPSNDDESLSPAFKKRKISPKIHTTFEIICITLDLQSIFTDTEIGGDGGRARELDIKWRVSGEEFPNLIRRSGGRWIIGGSEFYTEVLGDEGGLKGRSRESTLEGQEKSMEEEGTRLDEGAERKTDETKYPYSWTQNKTSLTLTFHLPEDFTPSKDILCLIKPHHLLLNFQSKEGRSNGVEEGRDGLSHEIKEFLRLGGEGGRREWWDQVDGEESTWTWHVDNDESNENGNGNGTGYGIMTIFLEKANHGVKWPQPFAPFQNDGDLIRRDGGIHGDDEEEEIEQDIEVPETVSEEEKAITRARLEHLHGVASSASAHSASGTGKGMGGIGSSNALPGLLREEMEDEDMYDDDEDDDLGVGPGEYGSLGGGGGGGARVGKATRFTYVSIGTGTGNDKGKEDVKVERFDKEPAVWLLSTSMAPLGEKEDDYSSIIIKSHVDGHVYKSPMSPASASKAFSPKWIHTSTNPALSFVLTSKRDVQYVHHLSSSPSPKEHENAKQRSTGATVVAFESRQANGMGGNIYVYWPIEENANVGKTASGKSKAEEGRQDVVKIGESEKGDPGMLLGVKVVEVEGEQVVVGLTERGLVLLTGL